MYFEANVYSSPEIYIVKGAMFKLLYTSRREKKVYDNHVLGAKFDSQVKPFWRNEKKNDNRDSAHIVERVVHRTPSFASVEWTNFF